MNALDSFINFLLDKERVISAKAAVIVFIILAVVLVDNTLGFTYYYNSGKKIEQIQSLNNIIKDTTTNIQTKDYAIRQRSEIIKKETFFSKAITFIQNLKFYNNNTNKNIENINTAKSEQQIPEKIELSTKNNFWFHISSGGVYYLLGILILILMPFIDNKISLIQKVATGILGGITISFFGLLFFWICSLIPQISTKTWFWNYMINVFIQFSIIGIITFIGKRSQKSA